MVKFHREQNALVTLAVRQRESSRQLLFDESLQSMRAARHGSRQSGDGASRTAGAGAGILGYSRCFAAHLSSMEAA